MNQESGVSYTRSDLLRLKMIGAECNGAVLDIGCGKGTIKDYLQAGCSYTGIDINPSGSGVYGDIYTFTATHTFDTILMLEVLEHLENPFHALRLTIPMLKTTGKLIISVPNPYNLDQIASVLHNDTNIKNPNHINLFGDNEINALCRGVGYKWVRPIRFYTKIPGLNWLSPIRSRFGEWNIYEVKR